MYVCIMLYCIKLLYYKILQLHYTISNDTIFSGHKAHRGLILENRLLASHPITNYPQIEKNDHSASLETVSSQHVESLSHCSPSWPEFAATNQYHQNSSRYRFWHRSHTVIDTSFPREGLNQSRIPRDHGADIITLHYRNMNYRNIGQWQCQLWCMAASPDYETYR